MCKIVSIKYYSHTFLLKFSSQSVSLQQKWLKIYSRKKNVSNITKIICIDECKNVGSSGIFRHPHPSQKFLKRPDKWKMLSAEFAMFLLTSSLPLFVVFPVSARWFRSMMKIYWSYLICIFLSCCIFCVWLFRRNEYFWLLPKLKIESLLINLAKQGRYKKVRSFSQ